jgi:tetratricopeptide (TPR) repeat protein
MGNRLCLPNWLSRVDGEVESARLALATCRESLGDGHPLTLKSMAMLGDLLDLQGQCGEAQLVYEEALAGRRANLGDAHPDTLSTMGNLGMLLQDLGKMEEARPLLEEALEGICSAHGENHPHSRKFAKALGELRTREAGVAGDAL